MNVNHGVMKSVRIVASVDPEIAKQLDEVAKQTPFKNGNMLLAAAAGEFAKLKKPDGSISNIWHALARITDEEIEPHARPRTAEGQRMLSR